MTAAVYDLMAQLAFDLPPARLEGLAAECQRRGDLTPLEVRSLFDIHGKEEWLRQLLVLFDNDSDISGRDLAVTLRAVAATAAVADHVRGSEDLTWTGPTTSSEPVRRTEQALCELIDAAKASIFIVSFVAYKVETVIKALVRAQDRHVELNILLETSTEQGGKVDTDSFKTLAKSLPRAHFFTWSKEHNPTEAAVHAKCAVADESIALITSANLTNRALTDNMELGVLIHGGSLPFQLARHLTCLIREGVITSA